MPELNGIELTSRLRGNHRTAGIPILMFSDLGEARDALAGYAVGADDYLPKPFELAILEAKVRVDAAALGRRCGEGQPRQGHPVRPRQGRRRHDLARGQHRRPAGGAVIATGRAARPRCRVRRLGGVPERSSEPDARRPQSGSGNCRRRGSVRRLRHRVGQRPAGGRRRSARARRAGHAAGDSAGDRPPEPDVRLRAHRRAGVVQRAHADRAGHQRSDLPGHLGIAAVAQGDARVPRSVRQARRRRLGGSA